MKQGQLWWGLAVLLVVGAVSQERSQDYALTDEIVVERGPHHRTVERVWAEQRAEGEFELVTNRFIQIETGLHYLNTNGVWEPSSVAIQITPSGAAVTSGQHKAWFSGNAADADAITLELPDGRRLISHVFGLGYTDTATGKAVLIAEVREAQGYVSGQNKVLYLNAFKELKADLQYTYTKYSFTQDILLHEAPPPPEEFGLASATTRLEVWTEFVQAPDPQISKRRISVGDASAVDSAEEETGNAEAEEDSIDFGSMRMGDGRTVWTGSESESKPGAVVLKSWAVLDNRKFLIEAVSVEAIGAELRTLPSAKVRGTGMGGRAREEIWRSAMKAPSAAPRNASTRPTPMKIATEDLLAAAASATTLNLDYTTLSSSYASPFTFKGENTYFVTGESIFTSSVTFEAGAVIKFGNANSPRLTLKGPVTWNGALYRPVVLTAASDQSVGERVWTNALSGYYAQTLLNLDSTNVTNYTISHARFAYASNAIVVSGKAGNTFSHMQFVNCQNGIVATNSSYSLRNALFHYVGNVLTGSGSTSSVEHITVDAANWLNPSGALNSLAIANSLLVGVASKTTNGLTTTGCVEIATSFGVFQTLGAGSHYLTWDSPYHGIGVTNLSASLIADLKDLSTRSPQVLTKRFTVTTNLTRRIKRGDWTKPDIGYYYPAVDYALGWLDVTNSTLTLTGGVVVAFYDAGGFNMKTAGNLVCIGTPTAMNRLVRYQGVQEQSLVWGTGAGQSVFVNGSANFRFTDFAAMADINTKRRAISGGVSGSWSFKDCSLRGIYCQVYNYYPTPVPTLTLTNNLWEGGALDVAQGYAGAAYPVTFSLRNNLFRGGTVTLTYYDPQTSAWAVYDNLFDSPTLTTSVNKPSTYPIPSGKNALYNCSGTLTSNLTITVAPSYLVGALGKYYYPTDGGAGTITTLIDADAARTPSSVGLYHYTIRTDQAKEAGSSLDVGFHYVATDPTGIPLDSDSDGIPDYLEDYDGSGSKGSGETDSASVDTDYDGRGDSEELWTDHTDPNVASSSQTIQTRLALWRFNNSLASEDGQAPTNNEYIEYRTNSWEGLTNPPGVSVSIRQSAGVTRLLSYPENGTKGHPNINPRNGTVRLWFLPNWQQGSNIVGDPNQAFGQVFCLKGAGNESWGLQVATNGASMLFSITNATGTNNTILAAAYTNVFTNTLQWHQIALTYSPTNASLYIDGASMGTSSSTLLSSLPWSTPSGRRFYVGCDPTGRPANGDYDYLETFNYPLSAATILSDYTLLAGRDSDHDGVSDLEEIRRGMNPGDPDSDHDGMPDGWELVYGGPAGGGTSLDPTADPDKDGLNNLREFWAGRNPNVFDSEAEVDWLLASDPKNLWNVDFGNGSEATGPAGAGIDGRDGWLKFQALQGTTRLVTADLAPSGVSLAVRYGPVGQLIMPGAGAVTFCDTVTNLVNNEWWWEQRCCPAVEWYVRGIDGYISWLPAMNSCYWIWPAYGDHTNCFVQLLGPAFVRHDSGDDGGPGGSGSSESQPEDSTTSRGRCNLALAKQDVSRLLQIIDLADNEVETWLPAFDTINTLAASTGVSASPLLGDYLTSAVDDGLCAYESMSSGVHSDTADATAEIVMAGVPAGNYYLYAYAGREGTNADTPTQFAVTGGRVLSVPGGGLTRPRYARGVNYGRILVQPHEGTIRMKSLFRNSAIGGLQLVRLNPLTAPSVDASHSSRQVGAALFWPGVPDSDGYNVYRADSSTSFTNYVRIARGLEKTSFKDLPASFELQYRYRVEAYNEVGNGPLSTPVNVAFTGFGTNVAATISISLNGIKPLSAAIRGASFAISYPSLRRQANVTAPVLTDVGFEVIGLDGGTLELATLDSNGNPGAYVTIDDAFLAVSTNRAIIDGRSVARWTPPLAGPVREIVDAFRVRAVSGLGCSEQTAQVRVLTKQPTAMYFFGGDRDNAVGDGKDPILDDGLPGNEGIGRAIHAADNPDPVALRFPAESTSGRCALVTNVVKAIWGIDAGFALLADGRLLGWGHRFEGELGDGVFTANNLDATKPPWFPGYQTYAAPLSGLTNVVDIAGNGDTFAVRGDGSVWAWGMDFHQDLFLGVDLPDFTETPYDRAVGTATNAPVKLAGLSGITAIAAGEGNCIVLDGDGAVKWWGSWKSLQNGQELEIAKAKEPTVVPLPERVVQIAAGAYSFAAVGESGVLYTWGDNRDGELGYSTTGNGEDESPYYKVSPKAVPGLADVASVAVGFGGMLVALEDGTVHQFGEVNGIQDFEVDLSSLTNVTSVSMSGDHAFAVTGEGKLFGWGFNASGQLGRDPASTGDTVWAPILADRVAGVEFAVATMRYMSYVVASIADPSPRDLSARAGDSQVSLQWKHFPSASSYRIERLRTGESLYFWLMDVTDDPRTTIQSAVDQSVANGEEYSYIVKAIVDGVPTSACPPVAARPVATPGTVVNASATGISKAVRLSWGAASHATTYELWGGTVATNLAFLSNLDANTNLITITDAGLEGGSTRYYNIRAGNASGWGQFLPSNLSVVVGAAGSYPIPPEGVRATCDDDSASITVAWTPLETNVTGTLYYRVKGMEVKKSSTNGVDFTYADMGEFEVVNVTTNATCSVRSIVRNGRTVPVEFGKNYKFLVSSFDDTGEGPVSPETGLACPTQSSQAPPLTILTASAGNHCVYLKWSGTAMNYLVRVSPAPPDGCSAGSSEIEVVYPYTDDGTAEWWLDGLNNSTAYTITISQNFDNYSAPSGTDSELTLTPSSATVPVLPTVQSVPGNNKVTLLWPGNDPAATLELFKGWRFLLERRDNSDMGQSGISDACVHWGYSGWTGIGDGSDGLTRIDTNAVNGVGYRYRLTALSPGVPTQVVSAITSVGGANWIYPVPTFPTNTVFVPTTTPFNSAGMISWSVVTNANYYTVERSNDKGETYFRRGAVTNATAYTDTGLENGIQYWYKITAVNTNSDTFAAAPVSVTPGTGYSPARPVNFTGTMGDGRVAVAWDSVPFATFYQVNDGVGGFFTRVGSPTFDYAYSTNSATNAFQVAAGTGLLSPAVPITVQPISWAAQTNAAYYGLWRILGGATNLIAVTEAPLYVDVREEAVPALASYQVKAFDATNGVVATNVSWSQPSVSPSDVWTNSTAQTIRDPEESSSVIVTLVGISKDSTNPTRIVTPTNVILRASVAVLYSGSTPPAVGGVDFYANGKLIGKASTAPYEFEWVNPPGSVDGRTNRIVARLTDTSHRVKDSTTGWLLVRMQPELSAYKAEETDATLQTRGLPLVLSRSYDSRNSGSGAFGRGWVTGWDRARLRMPDLSSGWSNIWAVLVSNPFNLVETTSHQILVALPDGDVGSFQPVIQAGEIPDYLQGDFSESTDTRTTFTGNNAFHPLGETHGKLAEGDGTSGVVLKVESIMANGAGEAVLMRSDALWSPSSFVYTSEDQTKYLFQDGALGPSGTEFWLYSVTDKFGNWIRYDSVPVTNPDGTPGRRLTAMVHCTGRRFDFANGTGGNTNLWCVYDSVGTTNGSPILRYKIAGLQQNTNVLALTEVHRLTDRGTSSYEVTKYSYAFLDTNSPPTNAVLSQVIDPEGVIRLENVYKTDGSGFLESQKDAVGVTSTIGYGSDADGGAPLTITTSSSSGTLATNVATYSRTGTLSGIKDPWNQTRSVGYDEQGRLSYTRDANGNYRSFVYDERGRVIATVDGLGKSSTTKYSDDEGSANEVTATFDNLGARTGFDYYHYNDPDARVSGAGDPEGSLMKVTDAVGGATVYHYNDYGQVVSEIRLISLSATGATNQSTYSSSGDLVVARDPLWSSTSSNYHQSVFEYDANGNRLTEVRWRSTVVRDTNGSNPVLTSQVLTSTNVYDAQGRIRTNTVASRTGASATNDLGTQITKTVYGAKGKPISTIDPLNRTTTLTYDARGNLIQTLYPDNTVVRTAYDALGRPIWSQERTTNTTGTIAPASQTIYDVAGRVVMTKRWDAVAFTNQVATPTTNVTDWSTQYRRADGFANVQYCMVVTVPTNAVVKALTRTQYDPAGRVQFTMDPLGHVTGYGYDATGRRTSVTNYTSFTVGNPIETSTMVPGSTNGLVTSYLYDANGNQVQVMDSLGRVTTMEYDALNRLVTTHLPVASGEASHDRATGYDSFGNRASETDEAGIVTAFGYDILGRLTSVTNDWHPVGTNFTSVVTMYAYDEVGNQTNQVDALNRKTTYEYDGFGRRVRRTLPGSQYETLTYDAVGNQVAQRTFNGLSITSTYDNGDRLLVRSNSGTSLVSYGYDVAGRRLTATNSAGVLTSTYDALGRMIRQVTPVGTLNYSYDAAGNLLTVGSATVSGVTNSYTYDALNRLATVVDVRGGTTASYSYDGVGNLQTVALGNGVAGTYTYDVRNRLTNLLWSVSGTVRASFRYGLGTSGNRVSMVETNNANARTYSWAYDTLYRLTNEVIQGTGPTGSVAYTYDGVGNRLSRATTGTLTSYLGSSTPNYDVNDQLDDNAVTNTISAWYNAAGSMLTHVSTNSGTVTNMLYDWFERLTNVSTPAVTLVYDADGNRVKKITATSTNLYLVATVNPTGYAQVVEESLMAGTGTNLNRYYICGADLVKKVETLPGTPSYYLCDGLGSVRALTSSGGAIQNTYEYDAFGTLIASSVTVTNVYLFTGEQFDWELGTYYLRARYMQPGYGRFLTKDTYEGNASDPKSLHQYLYCHDDPVNRMDPSGHMSMPEISVANLIRAVGYSLAIATTAD